MGVGGVEVGVGDGDLSTVVMVAEGRAGFGYGEILIEIRALRDYGRCTH